MALSTSQVLLYVADPADYDIALGAAAIAGIPASNVIHEFGYAWSDVASGDYLVIAVGAAALYALYYNQCGWNNPAGQAGGSTPFQLSSAPIDTLPGADYYENAAGSTATDTLYIAAAFAYYALHGSLPSNFSSYPTPISPSPTCSGSDALSCPCTTCVAPTVSPACSDYGVCGFVSEYEDWAKYAACLMGSHPLPLSLILAQWGDESGYGGSDICTCNNPGNQGASCGIGNTNCSVSGCPEVAYCSLKDGVDSYANLMAQGYPFVACTYEFYANSGNCAEGVKQAAIALGQGYSPVTSVTPISIIAGTAEHPQPPPREFGQVVSIMTATVPDPHCTTRSKPIRVCTIWIVRPVELNPCPITPIPGWVFSSHPGITVTVSQ